MASKARLTIWVSSYWVGASRSLSSGIPRYISWRSDRGRRPLISSRPPGNPPPGPGFGWSGRRVERRYCWGRPDSGKRRADGGGGFLLTATRYILGIVGISPNLTKSKGSIQSCGPYQSGRSRRKRLGGNRNWADAQWWDTRGGAGGPAIEPAKRAGFWKAGGISGDHGSVGRLLLRK